MKFMKHLKTFQGVVQLVGVITSAIIASLTAAGLGGDPLVGASIGVGVNTLAAFAST